MKPNSWTPHRPFWSTWPGICAILLGAALLFFLITEHTAHFFGFLPFGIFLLCPLMHVFMHHGHGGHDESSKSPKDSSEQSMGGHHH